VRCLAMRLLHARADHEAVAFYGLTPVQIFGKTASTGKRAAASAGEPSPARPAKK
jgi:hypothetical protein